MSYLITKKVAIGVTLGFLLLFNCAGFCQFLDFKVYNEEIFLTVGEIKVIEVSSPVRVSVRRL